MNKKILIILMAFMLIGTSSSLEYSVHARPVIGTLNQEQMCLIVRNLQKDIVDTQGYVNSAVAKFDTTPFDFDGGYNDLIKALDGVEKIETHLKQINYKGKSSMITSIKKTKSAIYLMKGFVEYDFYNNYAKGKQSLKMAIKYDCGNAIDSILNESALKNEEGNYKISEMYLTSVIESKKITNYEKAGLYIRRGNLRDILSDPDGALDDYKKAEEFKNITFV